ncbi:MAG: PQQ-dependent sugar dehydrogenase [Phycisphaeraceae bacterium]|nr:MAG: PQQ-dependent sugar dehydrogenase [Phycisphaeraceae bacterium]
MKHVSRLSMVFGGLLGVAWVAASASGQGAAQLWANNCASCHAADGRGGGAGTRSLLTQELMDQKYDRLFFDAIKKGVPDMGMAAFGETLKDEQIWSLVVHIRELQAKDLRRKAGSPKATAGVYRSQHHEFTIETVIDKGLRTPWCIAFVSGYGTPPVEGMLITNRTGPVSLWRNGALVDIQGIPDSVDNGQGGMMDVTTHPKYAENGWVYLAFAAPHPTERRRGTMTKVVRGRLKAEGGTVRWVDSQTIFDAKPEHYLATGLHFGVKLAFDPKDPSIVFFGIGERGRMEMAQDLTRPNGKIHRVHDDGRIPADNPFVNTDGAYPSIWSYGHRNPQGLVFDLEGNLWDTEHGPRGGDELNLIRKGRDYGWPTVSFGINYNDAPFRQPWPDAVGKSGAIEMPVYRWLPSIGACGLGCYDGTAFPAWRGDLFAGGLSGNNVDRLRVKNGTLVEREEIIHGMGRVRDVRTGPDGALYVTLNDPDRLIRLVPPKAK